MICHSTRLKPKSILEKENNQENTILDTTKYVRDEIEKISNKRMMREDVKTRLAIMEKVSRRELLTDEELFDYEISFRNRTPLQVIEDDDDLKRLKNLHKYLIETNRIISDIIKKKETGHEIEIKNTMSLFEIKSIKEFKNLIVTELKQEYNCNMKSIKNSEQHIKDIDGTNHHILKKYIMEKVVENNDPPGFKKENSEIFKDPQEEKKYISNKDNTGASSPVIINDSTTIQNTLNNVSKSDEVLKQQVKKLSLKNKNKDALRKIKNSLNSIEMKVINENAEANIMHVSKVKKSNNPGLSPKK